MTRSIDYQTSSIFLLSARQRPATDRQMSFLRTLVDKAMAADVWPRGFFWGGGHDLTAAEASRGGPVEIDYHGTPVGGLRRIAARLGREQGRRVVDETKGRRK